MRAAALLALRSLPLLLLLTTVTGWAAVSHSVNAARLANPTNEQAFLDAHASGTQTILGLAALLQLGIAVVLWRLGTAVRDGRPWSTAFAVIAPWPAACCGAGALTINPVTKSRWSGEPDGYSLAADHFPVWHWPVTCTLAVLIVVCCVTSTVALVADRLIERRR